MLSSWPRLPYWPLILLAVLLSATVYLFPARLLAAGFGYPLDDSWIHQTLARNLVVYGQMAVNPGEPAAVSTSPLWTLLLALGYLLGLSPFLWTYLIGGGSLVLLALATWSLGRAVFPNDSKVPWLAGLLVLAEWHLVWAAFSGMETVLFAALSLSALREAIKNHFTRPLYLGVLVGLLTLTRPEGVLMGLLLGGWGLLTVSRGQWTRLAVFAIALALTVLPDIVWNLLLSQRPVPSTFFAKNAAYGAGLDSWQPTQYLVGAAVTLARGPLLLAYPGLAYGLVRRFPKLTAAWPLPLAWCAFLVVAYMVWLPALYHHGRYLIPLIPIIGLYGLEGGRLLLDRLPFVLLPRVSLMLFGLVVVLSWARGAQIYGENVLYINQQEVRLALWARDNTPPEAVLATHDIGAMGYFSQRTLVDIAGLASPELTASPKDVVGILRVLEEKGVDFIVLQPDWYPPLYAALRADPRIEPVTFSASETETAKDTRMFEVLKRSPE